MINVADERLHKHQTPGRPRVRQTQYMSILVEEDAMNVINPCLFGSTIRIVSIRVIDDDICLGHHLFGVVR